MGQEVAMVQKHKKFLGKLEDGMFCCMASIYVYLLELTLFILLLGKSCFKSVLLLPLLGTEP